MEPPNSKEKFAKDFVAAWTKVMNLDRFERRLRLAKAQSINNKGRPIGRPFSFPSSRDHTPSVPAFAAA